MSQPSVVRLDARARAEITDQIGNTPLLRIRLFEAEFPRVAIYGKAEFLNPGGSVKDRPALRMVLDGERSGKLGGGRTLLDSTSGNTGIAYAMIGSSRGFRVTLVMPSNVSEERKQLISAYGAEIVYSDPLEGSDGAIRLAREMRERDPDRYFMPDQYNNASNWRAHYDTTAPEIWEQTGGEATHFVASLGTGGTFTGVTRRLREYNPAVQCISVQPDEPWHGLEGMKHMASSIVPGIYDAGLADRDIGVGTERAYRLTERLAREEGILVGHSAGAALVACHDIAGELEAGTIVTVLCDAGSRYLSGAGGRP